MGLVFDYAKKEEVIVLKKNTLRGKMDSMKYKRADDESDGLEEDKD